MTHLQATALQQHLTLGREAGAIVCSPEPFAHDGGKALALHDDLCMHCPCSIISKQRLPRMLSCSVPFKKAILARLHMQQCRGKSRLLPQAVAAIN